MTVLHCLPGSLCAKEPALCGNTPYFKPTVQFQEFTSCLLLLNTLHVSVQLFLLFSWESDLKSSLCAKCVDGGQVTAYLKEPCDSEGFAHSNAQATFTNPLFANQTPLHCVLTLRWWV